VGPAFSNPRAEHILPNSDKVWTFGVNWFPYRWVRITLNGIREEFDEPPRRFVSQELATDAPFWSGVARLQIVF
jgi:phosphate-selective porin